ncbi:hypothetical protein OF83DRAFT_228116 [Amylostereum chailletii]|nr:hypothetical protein OF83DRAFT_228116 [Amylostereum chailletii]
MFLPPGLPVSVPLSRTTVPGLPSDIDAPQPAKQSSRARARAEGLIQLHEEERVEEERALILTMYHLDTLVSPFETVKTDFADLDGVVRPSVFVSCSLFLLHSSSTSPITLLQTRIRDTTQRSLPRRSRGLRPVPHPPTRSQLPPLAPESTIRAPLYPSRRGPLPSFSTPGSPQLDPTRSLGRAVSRRRRRVSMERQPCRA